MKRLLFALVSVAIVAMAGVLIAQEGAYQGPAQLCNVGPDGGAEDLRLCPSQLPSHASTHVSSVTSGLISQGASYTVSPSPTTYLDSGGQLTNGLLREETSAGGVEATVGWTSIGWVTVTVDLGAEKWISSTRGYFGGGATNSIYAPAGGTAVQIAVSADNANWYGAGVTSNPTNAEGWIAQTFSSPVRGRYVRWTCANSPAYHYLTLGEVEVYGPYASTTGADSIQVASTSATGLLGADGALLLSKAAMAPTAYSVPISNGLSCVDTWICGTTSAVAGAIPRLAADGRISPDQIPTSTPGMACGGTCTTGRLAAFASASTVTDGPVVSDVNCAAGTIPKEDSGGKLPVCAIPPLSAYDPYGSANTVQGNLDGLSMTVTNHTSSTTGAHGGIVASSAVVTSCTGNNQIPSTGTGTKINPNCVDYSPVTTTSISAVAANASISGATKTKITYDSKGLVTSGADLGAVDIHAIYPVEAVESGAGPNSQVSTSNSTNWTTVNTATYYPPGPNATYLTVTATATVQVCGVITCSIVLRLDSTSGTQIGAITDTTGWGGEGCVKQAMSVTGRISASALSTHYVYLLMQSSSDTTSCLVDANRSNITVVATPY